MQVHRAAASPALVALLVAVSRLSNGSIWYATILLLPWLDRVNGVACSLRMVLLGLVDLTIYRIMKRYFARPRPYVACPGVRACTPSLDEHSFPSGHVLHAVAFGTLLCAYHPALAWIVWPFALLVATSRVVLGLHYLSDVVAGAALGWIMAQAVMNLF